MLATTFRVSNSILVLALCFMPGAIPVFGADSGDTLVPRMAVQIEDEPNPVMLEAYHARVSIHGVLARTSVTLDFFNHGEWDLEGELIFGLPEGATVTGYALDVGDVMVDAVAVEKEIGRIAFETEARGAVDPGLVEWVDGNVFRTKVYPIPSEGRRRIRVDSVSMVERIGARGRYTLPLAGLPALATMGVELSICNSAGPAEIINGPAPGLAFEERNGCLNAAASLAGSQPGADLVIEVGVPVPTAIRTDRSEDGDTVFVVSALVPDEIGAGRERRRPVRPVILWDASASRRNADQGVAVEAVLELLDRWRPREVALTVLRDEPGETHVFRVGTDLARKLSKVVDDLAYDGGTRIDRPEAWTGIYPDAVILVSDGRPTLGGAAIPELEAPVYAISVLPTAHHAFLRYLADSTGGAYLDLGRPTGLAALAGIDRIPPSLTSVEVLEGSIRELNAPIGRPATTATVLSGILETDRARLRLRFGDRGRGPWLDLEISAADGSGLETSFWAIERLAALLPRQNDHRTEIKALGMNHGLVTPLTSLIVFEDADQYARYRIEPPASLPEIREEYFELLQEQTGELADLEKEYEKDLRRRWLNPEERVVPPEEPASIGREGAVEVTGPVPPRSDQPAPSGADEVTDEMIEQALERSFEGEITVSGNFGPWSETSSGEVTIVVTPWVEEAPYLEALAEVSRAERYEAYLSQRADHGDNPGFFVDCARFFFEKEQNELGFRVLSNLPEIRDDDPRLLRIAAMLFLEHGRFDLAIELFERLLEIRPERPQSNRDLAMALIERARAGGRRDASRVREDLDRAAELLVEVIFRPWGPVPDHLREDYLNFELFPGIGQIALTDLNLLVQRYRRWFRDAPEAVRDLDPVFIREIEADLRVVITWDDPYADIDLRVVDPTGEAVWYKHPVSEAGGFISEDFTDGLGPEVFTIEDAPAGRFRAEVDYYGDAGPAIVGPVTVLAQVTTDAGRSTERTVLRMTRLNEVEDTFEVAAVTIGESGSAAPGESESP